MDWITKILIIISILFLLLGVISLDSKYANAQTVELTTSVKYNNCNIHTSYIPPPEITHSWENEYGWSYMGMVGSSPFYTIRSENRIDFWLDTAHWSYTEGDRDIIYDECKI